MKQQRQLFTGVEQSLNIFQKNSKENNRDLESFLVIQPSFFHCTKMKFSIKDLFRKSDQIRRFLGI